MYRMPGFHILLVKYTQGAVQLQVQVLYEQIDWEFVENVLHFVIQRILKHTFSQGGTERRCIN